MDRREFLKAGLFSLGMFIPGTQGWAYSNGKQNGGHKLVVVFLRGAIDGLNVVAPYGDERYYQIRQSIAIPRPGSEGSLLDLDGYFGLNPALQPLLPLWQNKQLAFVHASGSPDETRSHFDAQDYMESGVPGVKSISTGWLNRLLTQLPDNQSPIRAINVGPTLPRILEGPATVGMASGALNGNARPINLPENSPLMQMYGNRSDALGAAFRNGVDAQNQIAGDLNNGDSAGGGDDRMMRASKGAPSPVAFPNFGAKIAKLTHDPSVQVAFVALGGWDTHINQGASKGQLANKLTGLGKGLAEMVKAMGSDFENTTILVMSEFGRTAKENGNGGTDHGHGNVMWVLGGAVNGGKVYGRFSSLADRDLHESRDLPVTTDFRTVLSSVISEHLELSSKSLAQVFPEFTARERLALLT
ncbi:MAG TPA: DUF1501 domain-containing protein [Candidatus Obscuribacterales bacterium]